MCSSSNWIDKVNFCLLAAQQMLDVKIEFCIYVEKRYLECIEGFKTNYDKVNNVVQLVVLCSQGIKIPRD